MKPISELSLDDVKLIVFDVDGVLVRRGTEIKSTETSLSLELKKIQQKQIDQINKLYKLGYYINISSGRALYFLQLMFLEVLPFVSLTYENGSASWYDGQFIQHFNSYSYLKDIYRPLLNIKDKKIKGWEPKEFIITIHCEDEVPQIEEVVKKVSDLYSIWNGEAYDIGVKIHQTKSSGLLKFMKKMGFERNEVLFIGDNYNDKDLLDLAGVSVTADKTRVYGDYWVSIDDERLPADILMTEIIRRNEK